jgi:glycerate-2-kinase
MTAVVGNNGLAVAMAEERAQQLGYHTLVLSTRVDGEAREVRRPAGTRASCETSGD